ncbi:membrane protein [Novosphingobium barchaimii LL02]|uniref:Membrane protein n=2 Tax=Novosphingobium barchaimii TaxID=1420591 RepID=A0A0J8A935_9SPHN|nr:membrane protein [Novosphingobium barchaimii LL02]
MAIKNNASFPYSSFMMTRRLFQLLWGLALYGISMALMLQANLGLDPWDVLHQGLAPRLALSFGMTVNVLGLIVLLLWIPLRQRPGIGTVLNIIVIGTVVDLSLPLLPMPGGYGARFAFLIAGIALNGIAGGAYIGAGLGAGPRDGLMTGIASRTGWPIKIVRTAIELSVLAVGWLMGGTMGVGTVLYALTIGWVVHHALPFFTLDRNANGQCRNLNRWGFFRRAESSSEAP